MGTLRRACLALSGLYAAALGSWSFLRPGWHSVRVETAWIIFGFVVLLVLAGFLFGDTQGVLKGKTLSGVPIEGIDSVRIVR